MKRSISKIIMNMLLILSMAIMIPSIAKAGTIPGTGTGKEADPYKLTIGYCTDETFTYNPNSGSCYLNVTFTENVEVTCTFAENDPWAQVGRSTNNRYSSLKNLDGTINTFLAKNGETVKILIKNGDSQKPIHFKCAALSDTAQYCSQNALGKHTYTASYGAKCANNCGYSCTHPKASRSYYNEYTSLNNGKHAQHFECQICEQKTYDASDAKACTLDKWIGDNNHSYHRAECTLCNYTKQENCSFTKKTYKHFNWRSHTVYATCSVCGKKGAASGQNHTFKSNKCTKCSFKRIVPGSSKVTYIKQSGKMKVKNHYRKGYRNRFGEWEPEIRSKTYDYKIKIKFKKAKNAERYVVSTLNDIDTGVIGKMGKNKTSATFTYVASKKSKKVTLYLIPVSKTGTPGKSVKKVVKLKN